MKRQTNYFPSFSHIHVQKFVLILHLVKVKIQLSEPDLVQDVSYVEPDSNKFLKTNSEVLLIIVHWSYGSSYGHMVHMVRSLH